MIINLVTAATVILSVSCGQRTNRTQTTENVPFQNVETRRATSAISGVAQTVTPPDFSTEKGVATYLTGTWKFVDTQTEFENPGCTMEIDADLNISLSFYNLRTKKDEGACRGKITFDRFFANTGEAPDLVRFKLDDTERQDGGCYFFRHETVRDGKRVMTLQFASAGNDFIFDRINVVNVSDKHNGREYVFEQETGEQSTLEPRKDSEFYAVYWGGNREWMWLDDVVPNAAAASLPSKFAPAKTGYTNEVKQSVRYPVSSSADWEIGSGGMEQGRFYAIQTNRQGEVAGIRNATSSYDPSLEDIFLLAYNMPELIDAADYADVHIKYNQPVNGYNAEVFFMPEEMRYDKITGPASLRFTHQKTGKKRQVHSLYFAVPAKMLPEFEDKGYLTQKQTFSLDYGLSGNADETTAAHPLYDGELPFFFADVNFDGKQELLLTQFGQGQRGCSSYIVFSITPDGAFDDHLASQTPFDQLDDFSTIDSENKQITIPHHNGADNSFEEVYKQDENGKWIKLH